MVFRRRPPHPRRPRHLRRRPLHRAALARLRRANQLYDAEQWESAAELFEMLAVAAENRHLPQAPQLYLRAGQARVTNGESKVGVTHVRHAVKLFAAHSQYARLQNLRPRIVAILQENELEREAAEIDQSIHQILDARPGLQSQPSILRELRFPTKCPSCGGTVRPDELEQIARNSLACGYCGSIVQAD